MQKKALQKQPKKLMPRSPGNRSARAFTLIEMIVATFLLAIGIAGTMMALGSSSQASYTAERMQTAALLAQRQLTEIELQPSQLTAGDQQGDFGAQYPEYRYRQSIEATIFQDLYKVTVTVQWDLDHNPPRESVFTTYLRNPANAPNQNSQSQAGASQSQSATGAATGGNGSQ